MYQVSQLLNLAKKETQRLKVGEVFLLKELFKGYIWNRIAIKDRLLLGTLFLNWVNETKGSVEAIEKTSSNQQKYKKIEKVENAEHIYFEERSYFD